MSMKKIYVSGFYWSNGGGEYTIPVYHAAIVDKQIEELVGLLKKAESELGCCDPYHPLLEPLQKAIKKVRG